MRRRFLNSISNDYHSEYFTIEALEDGLTAQLSINTCEYRIDDGDWTTLSAGSDTPSINTGQTLSFRGNLTSKYSNGNGIGTFTISKKCNLKGNIMSLLYGDDFIGQNNLTGEVCVFTYLFERCTSVVKAHNLILPATTLVERCYYRMFESCTSLTSAPELPAKTLTDLCYGSMFYNCTNLTTAPELPSTTLAPSCYSNMFRNCSSLTTAPELPATTLANLCYLNMFYGCGNLNYIKMLATDISASNCLSYWVRDVASRGTFVKHKNMTSLPSGDNGIPSGWTVEDNVTLLDCISLEITADNVNGKNTNTTIYYIAQVNALDEDGNHLVITKTGTALSEEFPQNTSETESIDRTITFTYMGVTATTIITQGVWINQNYTIMLNDQWQLSDKPNPDTSLYDGVYESFSNKSVNSKAAIMYIDIDGYTDFDLYIRSYAESNYDYVMVSQLDQTIDNNTSYSNSTLVKAHTRGNQKSGNTISDYTKVSFTGITVGLHRITVVYRKDSSSHSGDDRGYLLIPNNQ